MLEAVRVLGEGEEVGDGLCLPLSVTQDAWPCDTPMGASPGARDRGRAQAILPEFCRYPQPLPALPNKRQRVRAPAFFRDMTALVARLKREYRPL